MTPEEAKANLGRAVEYVPAHKRKPGAVLERGVITSVGTAYACVRFEGDHVSKACRPSDLRLVTCGCEASPPEFGGNLPDRDCPLHGESA